MRLCATVIKVLYPKPDVRDADWFLIKTDQGICKGNMAWRPDPYSKLELDGEWCSHNGERQFRFASAMLDVPTDPRAQLHYACTRTPGVGRTLEQAIWDKAGTAWKSIAPGDVPRLSDRIHAELMVQVQALERDGEQARAVAWLMGKGASQKMACAAWERWENETTGIVTSNPFQLAELPHYGFRDVDGDIRAAFGIGDDDTRRVNAAIVYTLRQLTGGGSTVIEWGQLHRQCVAMIGGHAALVTDCARDLFADGTLYGFPESQSVALMCDFRDERDIWDFVTGKQQQEEE